MTQPSSRTAALSAEQLAEFERIVARFEEEWFAGKRPEIEPFLVDDVELRPVLLAELVRVDFEFRRKAGEVCRFEDYLARFPELAGDESLVNSLAAAAVRRESPDVRRGSPDPAEDATAGLPSVERPAAGQGGSVGRPATAQGRPATTQGRPATTESQAGKPDLRVRLLASRLVTEQQLQECLKSVGQDGNMAAEQFAPELLKRGWVTHWQLEQLMRGHTAFFVDQNRYVLLNLIGKGGMGAVYKARHVRMGRDVALKVIDPKRVTDQSLIQRFKREVEVCSKLQHEHIVQAFDVGEHAGATFLVLEFVEGADLASLVKRDGPMQPDEAAAICLQAAAGLAYAHSQGIVHRDIKPQNILLSTSGVVKILDMGLARVLDDPTSDPHTSLTQEGAVMGTVDYMPPEQAHDTRLADARSDIYSLGATLFYLLAGRPPHAGGSVIERLKRLALEDVPSISQFRIDCPRELDEIVQKMLAKRPEDRFQTAGDVVRALRPLAAERISGRAAVTAAVQSAADTLHAAAAVPTDTDVLFRHMDGESLVTKVRQRKTQRAALNRTQKLKLAAIVGSLMVVLGVLGWILSGRSMHNHYDTPNPEPPPPRNSEISARSLKPTIVPELPIHFGGVSCVAWSGDGQYLAIGSPDGDVDVRTPSSVTRVVRYDRHCASVTGVCWVPAREWIVSADVAGGIHIWRSLTGEPVKELRRARIDRTDDTTGGPAAGGATGLACSPDGKEIAYSDGKTIVRYSIPDFKKLDSLPLERTWWHEFRYSPSNRLLAVARYFREASGVTVYNLEPGDAIFSIEGKKVPDHPEGVELVMSAFRSPSELAVARRSRLEIWNPLDGKIVREFQVDGMVPEPPDGFVADGTEFAFWKTDGLRLVSTTDGKIRHFETPRDKSAQGLRTWDITSRSRLLCNFISYYDGLQIVRLEDGKTTRPWGNEVFGTAMPSAVAPAAIHGDFLLEQPHSRSWDLRTGELRDDLAGKVYAVTHDGIVRIVDDAVIYTQPSREGLAGDSAPPVILQEGAPQVPSGKYFWSGDGSRLFAHYGPEESAMQVWDAGTGKKIATFNPVRNVGYPTISYDGRTIATAPMEAGSPGLIWREPYDGNPDEVPANIYPNARLSFSAESNFLAWPPALTVFRIRDRQRFELPARQLMYYWYGVFSRTGAYLLVDLEIWRLTGSRPEKAWRCPDEPRAVHRLAQFPIFVGNCWFDDERHVALTYDASINIWDWRENKKLASLYFLPEEDWAFVNHDTGHYNGTPGGRSILALPARQGRRHDLAQARRLPPANRLGE